MTSDARAAMVRLERSAHARDAMHRFDDLWAAAVLAGRSLGGPQSSDRASVEYLFTENRADYVLALRSRETDATWLAGRHKGAAIDPVGEAIRDQGRNRRLRWSRTWVSQDMKAVEETAADFSHVVYAVRNNLFHIRKRISNPSDTEVLLRVGNLLEALLDRILPV